MRGAEVDRVEYRTIGACLRAPRFVVAYRPGRDWIYTARRVVASVSRVWGGAGAAVLPVDEAGEAPRPLLDLLRAYDPDMVAGHVPILADLAEADPGVIDKAVGRFANAGESPEEAWERLSAEPLQGDGWDKLAVQVDAWCSPSKGLDQDASSYAPREVRWFERHPETDREFAVMPWMGDDKTFLLDLSSVDPALALMIETRVGALDPKARDRRHPVELPVEDEDLPHLVRLAITGEARDERWDLHTRYLTAIGVAVTGQPPAALTGEEYLANTPFARTRRWLTQVRTAPEPPIVCVIGDTAADHALAVLCDRLFHHGAWVPLGLLNQDDSIGRSAKVSVYSLKHLAGAPDRPVLVTSASEAPDVVERFIAEVDALLGIQNGDDAFGPGLPSLQPLVPEELGRERGRCFLADPQFFALQQTVPVRDNAGEVSLLTPVQLPLPEAAERLGSDLRWYIDVWLPGHLTPARTALPSRALHQYMPGSIPDAIIRASRHGLAYPSANMGFVPAGGPPAGRLAHPLLRYPSAEQIFAGLAAGRGAAVERSDAGRRAVNAVELWGSSDAIITDLTGTTRQLLDAFLPPSGKRRGDYGSGYAIRGDGYLTFDLAAKALGADRENTRETLDRLLAINVLRRGLILNCERCRWEAFYPIEQVASSFTCAACIHASPLARGRWYKGDTEPAWNYGIDQVVRELLVQHGDLPLLAAADHRRGSSDFLWAPELIVEDAAGPVELDLCLIIDGRVIVGEAKSNGRLGAGSKGTGRAATRLVRAAQVLTADEIVLATSAPNWAPGTPAAMATALSTGWKRGPAPKLIELTSLGKAS
jgi:hypothetical protein